MSGKPKLSKDKLYKTYLKLLRAKKRKGVVSYSDLKAEGITERQVRTHFNNLKTIETKALADKPDLFPEDHVVGKRHLSKEDVYQRYIVFRKDFGALPKQRDITNNVCSELVWYRHYKTVNEIEKEARERNPEIFRDVSITQVKNINKVKSASKAIANHQKFFVTTAVTGCYANEKFYKAIKHWCKLNDAKLLILVSEDPAKQKTPEGEHTLDLSLINDDDHIIIQDTALNSNIHISTIKLSAKQIDATTGLDRLTDKGTFIYASPKQRLRPVPVANTKHVHLLVTTGAITEPDYKTDMFMSLRTAYLADFDHIMGGVILEIDEQERYHFRQVQMDVDGSFIDLGNKFHPNGKVTFESPIALHPGDWHTGSTCPMVKACIKDMCDYFKPKHLLMHDFFDGISINHHIEKDRIELALLAEKGLLNLEKELGQLKDELDELTSWNVGMVDIVYSNHDDFLNRYLRSAKYADPSQAQNHRISLKLALAVLDRMNPLEYAMNEIYGYKNQKKTNWLELDEDFILAGIQMGAHGHLGANGKHNPSIVGLEKVYKLSNTGHTHSSEILRGAWRAGTSTYLKLGYNKGPSSWSNSHIVTYRNGARQLIYTIEGKWHLGSSVPLYS